MSDTAVVGAIAYSTPIMTMGDDPYNEDTYQLVCDYGLIWNRILTNAELARVYSNPWQIWKPGSFYFMLGQQATGNSLAAGLGAYAETGKSSAINHGYKIVFALASYAESGINSALGVHHYLVGSKGAYSESGIGSTLKNARNLPGVAGSYSGAGISSVPVHSLFTVLAKGSHSESGAISSLVHSYALSAGTAEYQFVFSDTGEYGFDATLKSSMHFLPALGLYSETGASAGFRTLHHIIGSTGAYSEYSSAVAGLVHARFFSPAIGSCSESGNTSSLVHGYYIPSVPKGSYSEAGLSALYAYHHFFVGLEGFYSSSGQQGVLSWTHGSNSNALAAGTGSYSGSGISISARSLSHIFPAIGSYLEGHDLGPQATMIHGVIAPVSVGQYSESGFSATLSWSHFGTNVLSVSSGSYAESGRASSLNRAHNVVLSIGSYSILGSGLYLNLFAEGGYSSSGGVFATHLSHVLGATCGVYKEAPGSNRLLQSLSRRLLENNSYRTLQLAPTFNISYGRRLSSSTGHYPNVSYFDIGIYSESGQSVVLPKTTNLLALIGSYSESGIASSLKGGLSIHGSSGVYTENATWHRLLQDFSGRLLESNDYRILESKPLSLVLVHEYNLLGSCGIYFEAGYLEYPVHGHPLSLAKASYFESAALAYSQVINHLIASVGVYSEAGSSSVLKSARNLPGAKGIYSEYGAADVAIHSRYLAVSPGVYSQAGKQSTILHSSVLLLQSGSYSESSSGTSFSHVVRIVVGIGSYAESGSQCTLVETTPNTNALLASFGAYAETPASASIRSARHLVASVGSYSESGFSSSLVHSRKLACSSGAYAESGIVISQSLAHKLSGLAFQYSETGFAPSSVTRHYLVGSSGAYAGSGFQATVKTAHHLVGVSGGYTEISALALTSNSRHLPASTGGYSEIGLSAVQLRSRALLISSGSYAEVGAGLSSVNGHLLASSSGVYSAHGVIASPVHGHPLLVTNGSYSLSGGFASLVRTSAYQGQVYGISATKGSYAEFPSVSILKSLRHLFLNSGNHVEIGYVSSIIHGYKASVSIGSISQTGKPLVSDFGHFTIGSKGSHLESGFPATLFRSRVILASASSSIVMHPGVAGGFDRTGLAASAITVSAASNATVVPPPPTTPTTASGSKIRLVPKAWSIIARDAYAELGRFRHGDKVTMSISLPGVPDSSPIAVIFAEGTNQLMGVYQLPSIDSTNLNFALPMLMGNGFSFGTYLITYQFTIGGIQGTVDSGRFQVIPGGNPAGDVIFMHAIDRPEATFVLTQMSGGRLCVGRNPSIA